MAKQRTQRSNKSSQNKSGQSRKSSQGFAGTFDDAAEAVTGAVSRVPASAFYWGLGALALGAAAVGAYMYRERIVEVYEEAMESFGSSDEDTDDSQSAGARKSKLSTGMIQPESH